MMQFAMECIAMYVDLISKHIFPCFPPQNWAVSWIDMHRIRLVHKYAQFIKEKKSQLAIFAWVYVSVCICYVLSIDLL